MSTDKKPHPITVMAPPTEDDLQAALIAHAWRCREAAGTCERYLDSDTPDVSFDQVAHPGQLSSMAAALAVHAMDLKATEAAMFFTAGATHFGSAAAHLGGHMVYEPIIETHPDNDRLATMHDDERRFAARATKSGRQLVHRGLSKLSEMWPHAYDTDDQPRQGDDE